ncbi:hypothetical protein [uncultured Gammaproteobacteria bacterium]|uniref:Uncharacterized protein n=3 Tax=sulfur-oxidizing symbionts TaxID=32036 RepID=A0A1H6LF67_9GAMM|nr:hypothetical protein AZO1586R_104 [Bathymodiolus azoricus thioautotrophic gill symbiont]CAB5502438.1 hypothetical protein AZO1586I_960 [Bathymodiolus thermophilus thioautotrophic gill symbiont]CAC5856916.1 hypothetical protein [uncultured Gammaproteobacteria bacterium]CAC9496876.1 hypothetical protein [uncultured Gammaproteobacteria bacterium]CAC9502526.1 hypothetical protein [uncultured Gammaproteobacteria bacterium]
MIGKFFAIVALMIIPLTYIMSNLSGYGWLIDSNIISNE